MSTEIVDSISKQLSVSIPSVEIASECFSSGAFVIDVKHGSRLFVVMFQPGNGFGIDEVLETDGLGTACRHHSSNLQGAVETMIKLINDGI